MGIPETFKALSDPVRQQILDLLKQGPMSSGDIASHFPVSMPAVSRHLSVLKEAGLVWSKREGKSIIYEINLSILEENMLWISGFMKGNENEK